MEEKWNHVITVEDLEGLKKKISVLYDQEGVENARKEVVKLVAKKVKINGYRQGKAPIPLVERNCVEQINVSTKALLCQRGYFHACNENRLVALKEPEFKDAEINLDGKFTCDIFVEVRPTITPTGYLGLVLEKPEINVDALYKVMFNELQNKNVNLEDCEEIEDGCLVEMDFDVYKEGKTLTSGKGNTFRIKKSQPEPFGENLFGFKCGEATSKIKLPDNFKEFGGQEAEMKMLIRKISKPVLPNEEELAAKLNMSVEELKKNITAEAQRSALTKQSQVLEEKAVDKLLELHSFDIPRDWVEDEAKYLSNNLRADVNEQEVKDTIFAIAERNVRRTFILDAIYENEPKLQITNEDLNQFVEAEAQSRSVSKEQVVEAIKKQENEVLSFIKNRKIMSFILENATIENKENDNEQQSSSGITG